MSKNKVNKTKNKKDIKKEKEKINEVISETSDNIWRVFIIICSIIIIICLFYILAVHITDSNGETTRKSKSDEASISYGETIVGRSLSLNDKEYYVVFYDKSNSDISSSINESISKHNENKKHLYVYTVDMSEGLNKKYTGEESNSNPKKASDIVINGPTLIKVKNGKVIEYIEGTESISDYLNQ